MDPVGLSVCLCVGLPVSPVAACCGAATGLSLAVLDRVEPAAGLVHLRGVDVIEGTPILDIKPFCPYEVLGGGGGGDGAVQPAAAAGCLSGGGGGGGAPLRFPAWLLTGGRRVEPLRRVEITPEAEQSLRTLVSQRCVYYGCASPMQRAPLLVGVGSTVVLVRAARPPAQGVAAVRGVRAALAGRQRGYPA